MEVSAKGSGDRAACIGHLKLAHCYTSIISRCTLKREDIAVNEETRKGASWRFRRVPANDSTVRCELSRHRARPGQPRGPGDEDLRAAWAL